jgi:hypothetical protein
MSELQQLLEREVERIRPPAFTAGDVARRRDRKARARRVAAAITALVVFAGTLVWLAWGIRPQTEEVEVPASQPEQVDAEARRAYIREFQDVCRPAVRKLQMLPINAELDGVGLTFRSAYTRENVRGFRELAPIYHDLVGDLTAIRYPQGDRDAAHIIALLQQSVTRLLAVLAAADAGDPAEFAPPPGHGAQGPFEAAADEFWDSSNAAFQAFEDYGIRGCT